MCYLCVPVDEAAGQREDPVPDTGPSPLRDAEESWQVPNTSGMGRLRAAL